MIYPWQQPMRTEMHWQCNFQACEWVMGKKEENLFLVSKSVAQTPNSGSFEYLSI